MKRLMIATATATLATVAAFGQGQINFGNASTLSGWTDNTVDRRVKFSVVAAQFDSRLVPGGLVGTNSYGVNLTGLQATLYWSLTGGTDLGTYTRALFPSAVTFKNSTSATAGTWFNRQATLGVAGNGVPNGTQCWLVAVVWDSSLSSDPWSAAALNGGLWGWSAPFTYTPPAGSTPAPGEFLPQNLTGFFLGIEPPVFTPEPSTFALAGLGAAALVIVRRRKRSAL